MENEPFDESAPTTEAGKEIVSSFIQTPLLPPPIGNEQEEEKKTPLQYIKSGFFTAVKTAKNAGSKAKEVGKIGGTKIANAAITAGHFIADKTKTAATAVKNQSKKIAVYRLYSYHRKVKRCRILQQTLRKD